MDNSAWGGINYKKIRKPVLERSRRKISTSRRKISPEKDECNEKKLLFCTKKSILELFFLE